MFIQTCSHTIFVLLAIYPCDMFSFFFLLSTHCFHHGQTFKIQISYDKYIFYQLKSGINLTKALHMRHIKSLFHHSGKYYNGFKFLYSILYIMTNTETIKIQKQLNIKWSYIHVCVMLLCMSVETLTKIFNFFIYFIYKTKLNKKF